MTNWLISANGEKYNHDYYFDTFGYIDWQRYNFHYEVNDIVYIYSTIPQKIMYKTIVEGTDETFSEATDNFVRLRLLEKIDEDRLSLENLKENGLKHPPQGAKRFDEKEPEDKNLLDYIEKYFKEDMMIKDEEKCEYWLYAPGDQARKWDKHYEKGIMAIGWNLGKSLKEFEDWEELYNKVQQYYSDGKKHKTVTNMLWDFANTIKPGDIIFAKKGVREIVGKGIVESDYIYDPDYNYDGENEYMHIRKVKWLKKGSWPYKNGNKQLPQDTIMNITSKDPERLEIIKGFFKGVIGTDYSFESDLPRNVIYFGAPGTGKSFNLNKDKNEKFSSEIDYERVTFHPDYSYANFVGTYKPRPIKDDDGNKTDDITYEYVPGPFMRSLVKSLKNPDKPFLLIIEEINRANVSAVFGDVFQLLDRDENKNYESKYDIETSEDMRDYLKEELNQVYEKITIPSNMFIWATMNSADQGVFPMDTAFKRRWDFIYFDIDFNENLIEDIKVNLNGQEISWNDLRKAINNELLRYGINEDKLIGPFFAFTKYLKNENGESKEITLDEFKKIFKNKVIMYLFEDAARARRNELFDGARDKDENVIYSKICQKFENEGIEIFCENIRRELSNK